MAAGDMADRRARVATLEAELVELRRQLDDDFVAVIATSVGVRAFSSRELFQHQNVDADLRDTLSASNIRSPQQLGKTLQRLSTAPGPAWSLDRVGADWQGAIWMLRVTPHSQAGPSIPAAAGV